MKGIFEASERCSYLAVVSDKAPVKICETKELL